MHNKISFKYLLFLFVVTISLLFTGCTTPVVDSVIEKPQFAIPEDNFNEDNLYGSTLEEAFSLDESLYRVDQVRDSLDSFAKLTEKSKTKLSQDILNQIGNTGWEIQTLGFYNWSNTIEGTLRLQDYRIKKLELELAIAKYEKDELTKKEVEKFLKAFNEANAEIQSFINSYTVAD